jgi:hypothetical protein
MDHDIQLVSDGEGLAVIGDPAAIDLFLASEGLQSRDLGLQRLGAVLSAGAGVAQAGSGVAAGSGRWVQLTEKSAQAVKKYGLRESSTSGLRTGVVKGAKGQVGGFVEFTKAPRSLLTNPAVLSGAAGIMAQLAMQQSMDQITDYLASIDEKLDDVLRAQKDAVLADMIGVGLVLEEAMTLREHGGKVNDVTWSKAQTTSATIARTQAYALRQLDALAEKIERKTKIGDLADASREAERHAQEWLAVLARSFQLQDVIAVLELDRVLDAAPGDLDGHRLGLRAARQKRLDTISRSTERLMVRMSAAADTANTKVLLHPSKAPDVVDSSNNVTAAIDAFNETLGVDIGGELSEKRRWAAAASDVRARALETGADRVGAAKRVGGQGLDRAKSARSRFSSEVAERVSRRRQDDEP